MDHMCEELMPSVFTDEVLAETVAQIEGYENVYKSVETGARVYVGMDACEATVAYFDQWTAYTYFCLAKELAVFKQRVNIGDTSEGTYLDKDNQRCKGWVACYMDDLIIFPIAPRTTRGI